MRDLGMQPESPTIAQPPPPTAAQIFFKFLFL